MCIRYQSVTLTHICVLGRGSFVSSFIHGVSIEQGRVYTGNELKTMMRSKTTPPTRTWHKEVSKKKSTRENQGQVATLKSNKNRAIPQILAPHGLTNRNFVPH